METDMALERCEEEISAIDEAMDYLRDVRGMDDVIEILERKRDDICKEADGYRRELETEARVEEELLRQEYERDLLW